jgi:hypothetical protein
MSSKIEKMTGADFGLTTDDSGSSIVNDYIFFIRDSDGDGEILIRTETDFEMWVKAMGWDSVEEFISDTSIEFSDCKDCWCFQIENRVYADAITPEELREIEFLSKS